MLTFKMTSFKYLVNISVKISPNNNKLDSFKIYKEMAIENVQDGTSALEAEKLKKTKRKQ